MIGKERTTWRHFVSTHADDELTHDAATVIREVTEAAEPDSVAAATEPGARGTVWRVVDGAIIAAQVIALLVLVVITIVTIIYRYVLRSDPAFIQNSPDYTTLFFTWLIFLGIPRAISNEKNAIRLGLGNRYPERMRAPIRAVVDGVALSFFGLEIVSYYQAFPTERDTLLPTAQIPVYFATLALPIGAAIAIVFLLRRLASYVRHPVEIAGVLVGAFIPLFTFLLAVPPVPAALAAIVLLLLLDAPIAIALGVAGATMIINGTTANVSILANQLAVPTANVALLAVPLFMAMGAVFTNSTLADGLGRFVRALLGWLPGGLGVATIGTSAIFANITGSATADTAAIGTIYIPQMKRAGYPAEDAAALQAAAGVIGVIFPPAVAMILFASVASVDVITVFKATIIPGLLVAAGLMIVVVGIARRRKVPTSGHFSPRRLAGSIPAAIPVLLLPLILDGGIFSGIFTPSESGAVAIIATIIFAATVGKARGRNFRLACVDAMDNTTLVMFILTSVSLLDYGFVVSGAQNTLNQALSSVGHSPLLVLILVNLIFMIIHEFIDAGPAIIVMIPLMLPAILAAGVSPFQLAAVLAVNSSIGSIMPPAGIPLYVAARLADADPLSTFRKVVPYLVSSLVVLALVTVVPALSLWLT
jgi:tripartite ATP-independent transporter DctM subunit